MIPDVLVPLYNCGNVPGKHTAMDHTQLYEIWTFFWFYSVKWYISPIYKMSLSYLKYVLFSFLGMGIFSIMK